MQQIVYRTILCTCNGKDRFWATLCILKYLCFMKDTKPTFTHGHSSPLPTNLARLASYSDSDWAMCSTDIKSCSSNVICTIGDRIRWYDHKQPLLLPLPPRLSMLLCSMLARKAFP